MRNKQQRAARRMRNLAARELHTNKLYRPKVVKPRASEDNDWKLDLEEYYDANRNESRRPIPEAKEGGTRRRECSEDSTVSNGPEPEDWEEAEGKEETLDPVTKKGSL